MYKARAVCIVAVSFQGALKMRKKTFVLSLCATLVAFLSSYPIIADDELNPRLVQEGDYLGRALKKYEHGTLPEWGAKNPEQTDYFYVVAPKDGDAEGRPLYVALHSAGGSGQEELEWRAVHNPHNIYAVPDGFYGMFPDCGANSATDWWYGGRRADEPEINGANAERATAELTPVEKRILAEITWVVEKYKIDPNRIYLCGNSMGGSGTLGIGLNHGDVFAAVKANVPAGVWHAFDRLQLAQENAPEGMPDPPVCLDYSAPNDNWSAYHEALFDGMEKRKYSYIAYWGNFGHENVDEKVAKFNDLFNTFDWTSVRKDEAYPVFTNASTDDPSPWPKREADAPSGQRGAYFRWQNRVDSPDAFEIELRLATAEELKTTQFVVPGAAQADVALRRLQRFEIRPGETIKWSFGDAAGEIVADSAGLFNAPKLTIETTPKTLRLTK